jgi:anhydro-N-acetylmuramic acid kinase
MEITSTKILGLMSGTSVDGLDLALCDFSVKNNVVTFLIIASQTVPYSRELKDQLNNACRSSAENYFKLHSGFGSFIADAVNAFLEDNHQTADYIASHGHTVFHQPNHGFTTQIGCGATIAAKTGIPTICDFRSLDVALKGQGAPLVPIGDRDLFHQYSSCLNIGGIANISFTKDNVTHAFDICVANMALNYLTELLGNAFDDGGKIASEGTVNQDLLQNLMVTSTYNKSLGREWFEQHYLPLLNAAEISVQDKLATSVEYIAQKIGQVLSAENISTVLITGGGAYNHFLIDRLRAHFAGEIEIPSDEVIQFKEALIFAYLGYLRVEEKINTLSSVTKAEIDSIGGCIYL